MTGISGIHHVQVAAPAGCEDAARAFYGGLLGLTEIAKPPRLAERGGCWFGVGRAELHVGVAGSFIPATKAHPALRLASIDALDALASSLAESGVEIIWADDLEIPGQRRFHANDPWGNRLEFLVAS